MLPKPYGYTFKYLQQDRVFADWFLTSRYENEQGKEVADISDIEGDILTEVPVRVADLIVVHRSIFLSMLRLEWGSGGEQDGGG